MTDMTKRIPNFSPGEKTSLMRIILKQANIIESKTTNKVSIDYKSEAWKQITNEFNSTAPILCYRTAQQLKRLYENKKKDLRKKLAENKQEVGTY
nr:unnamed protein product [Callosobruchus analis]